MQSEKFTLFDFLAFAIPGATYIFICYFLFSNLISERFNFSELNEYFYIAPYLLLSYFTGHLLSAIGFKMEKKYTGQKKPWTVYLKSNEREAEILNNINQTLFKNNFFEVSDGKKIIDSKKSGSFFDNSYNYLEINLESNKIGTLMTQYAFFRTCSALWLVATITLSYKISSEYLLLKIIKSPNGFLFICFILFFIISIYLMRKRKLLMMKSVYQTLLVYQLNNHKPLHHELQSKKQQNE